MDYSPQTPLSMGFSRQEYWSGLPCPPPEDVPDPGVEPGLSCHRQTLYQLRHQEGPWAPPNPARFLTADSMCTNSQTHCVWGVDFVMMSKSDSPCAHGGCCWAEGNPVIPKEEENKLQRKVGFSGPCSCKGWSPDSDVGLIPQDRPPSAVPHCLPAGSLICGST